jgi:hypothetical protein
MLTNYRMFTGDCTGEKHSSHTTALPGAGGAAHTVPASGRLAPVQRKPTLVRQGSKQLIAPAASTHLFIPLQRKKAHPLITTNTNNIPKRSHTAANEANRSVHRIYFPANSACNATHMMHHCRNKKPILSPKRTNATGYRLIWDQN